MGPFENIGRYGRAAERSRVRGFLTRLELYIIDKRFRTRAWEPIHKEREGFNGQDKSVGLSGHYDKTGRKDKGPTDRIRVSGCRVTYGQTGRKDKG